MYRKALASLFGLILFGIGSWLNYYLLTHSLISSGDFVTLELAALAAGLLIAFLSNISEISSASFVIKLREAQAEAQVTMRQLESLLVAAFEPQLAAIRNHPSGFFRDMLATQDPGIAGFFELLESIERAKLTSQLSPQIAKTAHRFAKAQLSIIGSFVGNHAAFFELPELPTASQIRSIAKPLYDPQDAAERFDLPIGDVDKKIEAAIACYEELYPLALTAPSARHTAQPG